MSVSADLRGAAHAESDGWPEPARLLAAAASSLYLRARWAFATSDAHEAGRSYREAANLWVRVAEDLRSHDPVASVEQRLNGVSALSEGGDVRGAVEVLQRAERAVGELAGTTTDADGLRSDLDEVWARVRAARLKFQEFLGPFLHGLARAAETTAGYPDDLGRRLRERFPAYHGGYGIGFHDADRLGAQDEADRHLEDCLLHLQGHPEFIRHQVLQLQIVRLTLRPDPLPAADRAWAMFREHQHRSARVAFAAAITLGELSQRAPTLRTDLLQRAADAARVAIATTPSDLSERDAVDAALLLQFLEWRLGWTGSVRPVWVPTLVGGRLAEEIDFSEGRDPDAIGADVLRRARKGLESSLTLV